MFLKTVRLATFSETWQKNQYIYVEEIEDSALGGREEGEIARFEHSGTVGSAAFSPDGKKVATCTYDELHIWDIQSGRAEFSGSIFSGPNNKGSGGRALCFSPDGRYLLVSGRENHCNVLLFDIAEQEVVKRIDCPGIVNGACFSPDGRLCAIAGQGRRHMSRNPHVPGFCLVGDLSGAWQAEMQGLRSWGDDGRFSAYGPGNYRVLLNDGGESMGIWDVSSGQLQRRFAEHLEGISCADISQDGTVCLIGDYEFDKPGRLYVVGLQSGKVIKQLPGHKAGIRSVALSLNASHALSGSEDGTCRLWDVSRGCEIRCYSSPAESVTVVDFSPCNRYALVAGFDGIARLFQLEKNASGVS